MNNGQSNPSPAIRAVTNEFVLAGWRALLTAVVVIFIPLIAWVGLRLVSNLDDNTKQVAELRREIGQQIEIQTSRLSDFKIEVARTNATTATTMVSIQNRMDAQSRRMDGFDGDLREINKKLYEGRTR